MKVARVICLLLVSLLALSPVGAVSAQGEPEYELSLTPADGRYNTIAMAGREKDFRVDLENLGDAAVDRISFSGEVPEGWSIKFDPPRLASLAPFESERIYATIKIPEGTEAGDYMISISAAGEQASAKAIEVRVTVKEPPTEEAIEARAVHPRVEAIAGQDFVFEVEFKYTGQILGPPRDFELIPKAPQGWEVYMTPQFQKEKRISAIDLKPGSVAFGDKIRLVAKAPFWPLPEPGEYKITLDVVSGDLKDTLELIAVITAKYELLLGPAGERYNTTATAGRDNFFSLKIGNLGTAPIENIKFSADKPEGWAIEFKPDKVESLEALATQAVDINIKPPPETIAGDYMIKIRASGVQATSKELQLRVTVKTPTIWGWVGVAIIVVVIAGLLFIFMRFSRR
ncbi:MAG TPA: hypothetical protein G4O01_02635 [Dehalococcoidia bacterium]|nr:hypothetical protein [Dehalococcoidia bacterium]